MSNSLVRPRSGRLIAGVCRGIAERFGWSTAVVRLAFIASCFIPGPQFVVYLVLWVLIPEEGSESRRGW